MKNNKLENTAFTSVSGKARKAPYAKPDLRHFGSVRTLTKGGAGTKADGKNSTKK